MRHSANAFSIRPGRGSIGAAAGSGQPCRQTRARCVRGLPGSRAAVVLRATAGRRRSLAVAVLVVFVFLRDWRATAISALAIPLSAIPTFAFMYAMDFTLNSMSMLALSLVAGVLVDDAIVEIENIVRHMRMGT